MPFLRIGKAGLREEAKVFVWKRFASRNILQTSYVQMLGFWKGIGSWGHHVHQWTGPLMSSEPNVPLGGGVWSEEEEPHWNYESFKLWVSGILSYKQEKWLRCVKSEGLTSCSEMWSSCRMYMSQVPRGASQRWYWKILDCETTCSSESRTVTMWHFGDHFWYSGWRCRDC